MLYDINIKFYLPFPPEVYSQTMKNEKSEVVEDFKKLHVNKAWCVFERFFMKNKKFYKYSRHKISSQKS